MGATFLGFAVGVAGLSNNWFVKTFVSIFVEVFRNVSMLLQVFFWNFVVILSALPNVRNALSLGDAVFVSNRGIFLPVFDVMATWAYFTYSVALVVALAGVFWLRRFNARRFRDTAQNLPVFWLSLGIFICAILIGYAIAASATHISYPQRTRFSFNGGFQVPIPLFSLWVALVCYTGLYRGELARRYPVGQQGPA